MTVRGNNRVFFDWLEWEDSRRFPTPYTEPNHRGPIRGVIEVDDVASCYEILRRSPWAQQHRIILGPPEEWNLGRQFGTRIVLNFLDPEGVQFQLMQQGNRSVFGQGKNWPDGASGLHGPSGVDLFPS